MLATTPIPSTREAASMPSCNPFLFASPSFFAPFQLPITGKLYDILVSRYKAVNCPSPFSGTKVPLCYESRNPVGALGYGRGRLVISDVLNRAQRGVLGYLERAESKEADSWYAADYRLAWQVVTLSDEGQGNAYAVAFLKTYGRPPEEVTWWWRDRQALWNLAQACGSSTPLLHANQAPEVLSVIPDFDPSAVPSSALPPKKPAASLALESGDSARPGAAGRKKG